MARYRLLDAEIRSIALAKTGANRRRFALLKEQADGPVEHVVPILKAADDWRVAYIVMAEPGAVEDGGMLAPGVEDVWDAEEIAKAAHSFLRNGGLTTGAHFMDEAVGRPVENFIAPMDFPLGDELVKAGSWVLGFEPSTAARAQIDAGEFTGMSIEGTGRRVPVEVAKAKYVPLHPPIIHHGRENWVDKVGGLPGPIDAIARVLIANKMPESEAVATAISQAEKQCATGLAAGGKIKLGAEARATICGAVADLKRKEAQSKAMTVAKARIELAKFNTSHVPAGSAGGGQFAPKSGGGGAPSKAAGKGTPKTRAALARANANVASAEAAVRAVNAAGKAGKAKSGAKTAASSKAKFARALQRARSAQAKRAQASASKALKAHLRVQNKAAKSQSRATTKRYSQKTKQALKALRAGTKADRKGVATAKRAASQRAAATRAQTAAQSQARARAVATVRASSARARSGPKASVLPASTVRSARVVR